MNVTELARKLKITKEQLFDEIEKLGFDIGRRAIKIDDRQANRIFEALQGKVSPKKLQEEEEEEEKRAKPKEGKISLPDRIAVRDFAEKMNMPITETLGVLMKNGVMASQNEEIDFETAAIIAEDLGFQTVLAKEETAIHEELQDSNLQELLKDDPSRLQTKPPVVVVLGHVDHGKTALLDAIRETDVVSKESGGITQHIGAYQIVHKDKKVSFIDTPGHEAFTKMRGRGAKVADIAILVVAADDGIKPQTEEAIDIIKKAKLPFLVAINKIDKPDADSQKVKQQLTQHDLNPEEWGGEVVVQEVSAKQKTGIKELLDVILLLAEVEKDRLLANPKREAVGSVIESHVDKGEGPVATVMVRTGTLHTGNLVTVGDVGGKIKALKDHAGKNIKNAEPGQPVKIIGLKGLPKVGDILHVIEDKKLLKKKLKQQQIEKDQVVKAQNKTAPQQSDSKKKGRIKYLNIVLKTDNLGSQEAISQSLNKMKTGEVAVNIIKKGLGNITGQDVIDADTADGWVLGFNVSETAEAQEVKRGREFNQVKESAVIYELIDEVKEQLEELLDEEIVREDIGILEIMAVFSQSKSGTIVGGRVTKGKIKPQLSFELVRKKEVIGQGKIRQVQIDQKVVEEVTKGSECGLKVQGVKDFAEGDKVVAYQEHKRARKLAI